jgi:hypothetical protein
VTVYYLTGTTGWDDFSFDTGVPVVLWNPSIQAFGIQSNQFALTITGPTNIPIIVQACATLGSGAWTNLQSCTLTNGTIYLTDSSWTNYPGRFYRISCTYP